jgi:hypothetical protein
MLLLGSERRTCHLRTKSTRFFLPPFKFSWFSSSFFQVGALLDKCDPFRAAKTMVAMKGVASPSLAERGREEKQFFDAFGLTAEFLAQYFASDSVQVDAVVRVASFCFHEKFGVPAKKGLIVGRDLVDWLADIGGVDDRAKAIKLSEDFVTHRLLTSQISGDKKKCVFVDGDAFFRIDRNLLDQLQSLLENVEEKNDVSCNVSFLLFVC